MLQFTRTELTGFLILFKNTLSKRVLLLQTHPFDEAVDKSFVVQLFDPVIIP